MWRSLLSLIVVASACACSSSPTASRPPATGPTPVSTEVVASVPASPSLGPTPTESGATNPSSATGIETAAALFVLRDRSFGVNGQTVVPIRNVGPNWIRIRATESRYRVVARDGTILFEDSFPWSYPSVLGPGAHGYLATSTQFAKGKAADVVRIEVQPSFQVVDKSSVVTLILHNIVTKDDIQDGVRVGVVTTGTVTNSSSMTLPGYDVGAVYFDNKGRFLGYSALNPGPLRAHQTLDFTTIPLAGPAFDRAAIAKIEVFPASACDVCP